MADQSQSRLSISDITVIAFLGIVSISVLALITSLPLAPTLAACSAFVTGLLAYSRFSSKPRTQNVSEIYHEAAQQAELKGEARLASSFQEAILIVNEDEQIAYVNPAAQALFPAARSGSSMAKVIANPDIRNLVQAVLSGEQADPVVYQTHTVVERHIRVTASPLNLENAAGSNRIRAIVVFYDVTDLERANMVRADFLANASHELKTPVASLLGYIETLNGHAKDDENARAQFLGIMQQQAERMQRLIDDLLSLRRIEQTEHIAPTETADFFLAARAAMEAVAPMAEARDVETLYEGPTKLPVYGKQDELVQLVLNIVDNAVQISSAGRKVEIQGDIIENWQPGQAFDEDAIAGNSARRRIVNPPKIGGSYTMLRIRDYGPGFKSEHLPRLCERFYRIAGDRKDKGTGLGLAIVKHIIMRHRGGLLIESAEGHGTEFKLLLPASPHEKSLDVLTDGIIVTANT